MRSSTHTEVTPATGQQMDRSNDPDATRDLDQAAPEAALASRRQRLTGEATGVGSIGFDESGAFDVGDGAHEPPDEAVTPPLRSE
ncbi:MAG: Tat pathway signal protein [Brevundimonas sp.]|uniref:Tat pathway signal protein n=1 Tax=Brevundimonas sp. TaxID=1871086 RepID=UPI0027256222|nr:Tat pathway signal protein [Brevundimonas sp.]MDO9609444.1 Tat pathway signal protein [Brevundimonas sp.]